MTSDLFYPSLPGARHSEARVFHGANAPMVSHTSWRLKSQIFGSFYGGPPNDSVANSRAVIFQNLCFTTAHCIAALQVLRCELSLKILAQAYLELLPKKRDASTAHVKKISLQNTHKQLHETGTHRTVSTSRPGRICFLAHFQLMTLRFPDANHQQHTLVPKI